MVKYFCDQCGKEMKGNEIYDIVVTIAPSKITIEGETEEYGEDMRFFFTQTIKSQLCATDMEYIKRILKRKDKND